MNRQIRRFGVVLLGLYGVLFLQLNWIQVVKSGDYAGHPANTRAIIRDFGQPRGSIQTADGVVVARSVDVDKGLYARRREYPHGPLYAAVTGFFSFTYGTDGVEKTYNDELTGRSVSVGLRSLGDLFLDRRPTANVTLTIPSSVQQAAAAALGDRRGAVVAIDPRDGAVLALITSPSFDPNQLSDHDQAAVTGAREALLSDPRRPLSNRATRERYFPGSTFKIITASAGIESGLVTPTQPNYPVLTALELPTTNRPLRNFAGGSCGGALFDILRESCNTSFAQMGLDLGADVLVDQTRAFGFGEVPPFDLPATAMSVIPDASAFDRDLPGLAQSAIGQRDVQATPLQMALAVGAVANAGLIMQPHVLAEVRDDEGEVVRAVEPTPWRTAISAGTADLLRSAMIGVVESGTATRLKIAGVQVAAKTGTAELSGAGAASHAWIVAFAPAEAPRVALAVFVEGDASTGQQTGGAVAAPIAKAVLEAVLALPDRTGVTAP